jgi:hypothetical protein
MVPLEGVREGGISSTSYASSVQPSAAVPSDSSSIMVCMNRLSTEERAQIIGCLVEGNSIRATVRMSGAAKNTITKLLVELGAACAAYQNEVLRDLDCVKGQQESPLVAR